MTTKWKAYREGYGTRWGKCNPEINSNSCSSSLYLPASAAHRECVLATHVYTWAPLARFRRFTLNLHNCHLSAWELSVGDTVLIVLVNQISFSSHLPVLMGTQHRVHGSLIKDATRGWFNCKTILLRWGQHNAINVVLKSKGWKPASIKWQVSELVKCYAWEVTLKLSS